MKKKQALKIVLIVLLALVGLVVLVAGIHMLFAFPMLSKMLNIFDFYNVGLFAAVTLIGYLIFGALYVLFYKITSKSYLVIVGGKKQNSRSDKE